MTVSNVNNNVAANNAAAAAAASNVAPNPPAALTTEQKIAVAANKLSKTALDNLWEENVTNVSLLMKVYGLFCYAWNRSTAVEADKRFGATIEQFNKAADELVKAVFNRALTPEESSELGVPQVKFANSGDQLGTAQLKAKAEEKLKEFYAVFKQRVTVEENINDNSDQFGIFAAAAQKIIKDRSTSEETLSHSAFPHTIPVKINTTLQGFNVRIFDDMVNGYANQPIANITIDSFKDKAGKIKGFFKSVDSVDIETKMRQAIKDKHDNAALNAVRDDFVTVNGPRFVTAREAIEAKLNAEKTALEAELAELRGAAPNYNTGTINAAYLEQETARVPMETAYTALTAYAQQAGVFNVHDRAATIAFLTTLVTVPAAGQTTPQSGVNMAKIQQLLQEYTQKATEFNAKKEAFDKLVARLAEIATFNNSPVYSGGRLFNVDAGLQGVNLDAAATAETAKHADFYNELSQVVGENNKTARSRALHTIMNRVYP